MDKKIFKNYLYNVMYQMAKIVIPLITIPYLVNVFTSPDASSSELLSIDTNISTVVQWFRVFGILGIHNYGNRQIARVRDNKKDLSKTFFEIYLMQLILMVISTLSYLLYVQTVHEYKVIFYIQVLTLVSNMIDITWFYYGIENFKQAAIRNLTIKLVGVMLIFTFVKSPDDFVLYVIINCVTAVLGQLIMWSKIPQYVERTKIEFKNIFHHIKQNIIFFIPQMSIEIYTLLPYSVLDFLGRGKETYFVKQAKEIINNFLLLITSTGQILLSRVSNLHANQEGDQVESLLQTITRYSLLIAIPMMFGIIAVMPMFIPWYLDYKPEYYHVTYLIIMLCPNILFITISNVYGIQYLMPVGKMKQYIASTVTGAVVSLIMLFALVPYFGQYGAIISIVCCEFAVVFVQWMFAHKKINIFSDKKEILKFFIAGIIMMVIVSLLGYTIGLKDSKPIALMINGMQAIIGIITYFGLLWVMKSNTLKDLLSKVRR